MGIQQQQIGWSDTNKLLWKITKQLDQLIKVTAAGNVSTTTTTTTL